MTEQELEVSKKLFYNMLDIVLVISCDGKILYGNKSALKFYGYSEKELLALSIYQFRKRDEVENVRLQLNQAATDGIEFETIHYKKNGEEVPVKVRSISYETCENGTVVSIIQDLSKLKFYSEKAKMFDISLDALEEAIIVLDTDFNVTIWNKAAVHRFGYTEDEIIGEKINILIPAEEESKFKIVTKLLKLGQIIERTEVKRRHKNNTLIDVKVSYSPIYNQYQTILGYIGIFQDITEVKKLNSMVTEYEQKAAIALENGKIGVWDIHLDDNSIKIYNNLNSKLKGTEVLDQDFHKWMTLIHPEDVDKVNRLLADKREIPQEFDVEYRIMIKKGNYRWLRTKGKVIEYKNETIPVRLLGTSEDVTERKAYEQALINKNNEMKKLMALAEEANRAKTQFLANMSHEIRTPLNGIITATQLLENMQGFTLEQEKLIKILGASSESLLGIVTDILDISKAEQKKMTVKPVEFSLKNMMQSIFNELQLDANTKGIEARYLYDPKLTTNYVGDAQKIKQIICNLLTNAIKFTKRGYISLKVKLLKDVQDYVTIEFEVKDTGIGIDKENIEKIFEAFTQLDSSMDKTVSGTGLGLAIAKQLAELLEGKICCSSIKNRGSSFSFTCPVKKVSNRKNIASFIEPEQYKNDVNHVAIGRMSKMNKTILSVDDNIMNQGVLEYIIANVGCNYRKAYNGKEALDILAKEKIDLILMDIQLPGMNGYKLAEKILENVEYKNIPIIAMTAYSQSEDKEKCLSVGMRDFIAKPLDVEVLMQKIKKMIQTE